MPLSSVEYGHELDYSVMFVLMHMLAGDAYEYVLGSLTNNPRFQLWLRSSAKYGLFLVGLSCGLTVSTIVWLATQSAM